MTALPLPSAPPAPPGATLPAKTLPPKTPPAKASFPEGRGTATDGAKTEAPQAQLAGTDAPATGLAASTAFEALVRAAPDAPGADGPAGPDALRGAVGAKGAASGGQPTAAPPAAPPIGPALTALAGSGVAGTGTPDPAPSAERTVPAPPAPPGEAAAPDAQPGPPRPAAPRHATVQALASPQPVSQQSGSPQSDPSAPALLSLAASEQATPHKAATRTTMPGVLSAPEPSQQLARAVAVSPGDRVIEVRLDPPSLGRVRMAFDFTGDQVRAVVSAAEPEALGALRRGHQVLMRELSEMGIEDADVTYADDGRRDADEAAERFVRVAPPPSARPAAALEATNARAVSLHDGALNIIL